MDWTDEESSHQFGRSKRVVCLFTKASIPTVQLTQPPFEWPQGAHSQGISLRGLTTHFCLLLGLRMNGAVPELPLIQSDLKVSAHLMIT
jgi:hypothetical protein